MKIGDIVKSNGTIWRVIKYGGRLCREASFNRVEFVDGTEEIIGNVKKDKDWEISKMPTSGQILMSRKYGRKNI